MHTRLQVANLQEKLQTLEHERDFYFDKLRDIEIMCQWPALAGQPVRRGVVCHTWSWCWRSGGGGALGLAPWLPGDLAGV